MAADKEKCRRQPCAGRGDQLKHFRDVGKVVEGDAHRLRSELDQQPFIIMAVVNLEIEKHLVSRSTGFFCHAFEAERLQTQKDFHMRKSAGIDEEDPHDGFPCLMSFIAILCLSGRGEGGGMFHSPLTSRTPPRSPNPGIMGVPCVIDLVVKIVVYRAQLLSGQLISGAFFRAGHVSIGKDPVPCVHGQGFRVEELYAPGLSIVALLAESETASSPAGDWKG